MFLLFNNDNISEWAFTLFNDRVDFICVEYVATDGESAEESELQGVIQALV